MARASFVVWSALVYGALCGGCDERRTARVSWASATPSAVAKPTPLGSGSPTFHYSPPASSVPTPRVVSALRGASRADIAGGHVMHLPIGASLQRSLIVALDNGPPAARCTELGKAIGDRAFVVCPKGTEPTAVKAAIQAAKGRYKEHVAPGPAMVFAAGEAVSHATTLMQQSPAFFATVLLAATNPRLPAGQAVHFARRGGKRVLMICQRDSCAKSAARTAPQLRSAGAAARIVRVPTGPKQFDAASIKLLKPELSWLMNQQAAPGGSSQSPAAPSSSAPPSTSAR